ncbi:hypothetical protein AQUCO_01600423v1 [Aquilegia coerulea]|uniref:Uncharacterized protein n=1 Tax=Aquilegia coerulea TaxID=218851 RepID=A0A2G5DRL1_AQUCA|nr:hypothetical protein AQUCO_01600423v1 [Aquilegia coerulea]
MPAHVECYSPWFINYDLWNGPDWIVHQTHLFLFWSLYYFLYLYSICNYTPYELVIMVHDSCHHYNPIICGVDGLEICF